MTTELPEAVSDRLSAGGIAVLIPCFNEELTVGAVIRDFQEAMPGVRIYVCDNASTDSTAKVAQEAGAEVIFEPRSGKGFAVSTLFHRVEADVYIMIDGDDTYPVNRASDLVNALVTNEVDMVVGSRLDSGGQNPFRRFHRFGNRLIASVINVIFDSKLNDILSGMRVFSRNFVKSVPLVSRGFEIETQMTIQALYYDFSLLEIPIELRERPENSHSKLRTFVDGARILLSIFNAFKAYRPLLFFCFLGVVLGALGWVVMWVPCGAMRGCQSNEVIGYVFLAGSILCLFSGLILDTINHRMRELGQLVVIRTRKMRD